MSAMLQAGCGSAVKIDGMDIQRVCVTDIFQEHRSSAHLGAPVVQQTGQRAGEE